MSRALLKKSLAFVKTGGCDKEKYNSVNVGEKPEEEGINKKHFKKGNATKRRTTQQMEHSANLTSTEAVSLAERNLLYFTERRGIKKKVIQTVSQSTVQSRKGVRLTPAQVAAEKRKNRLDSHKRRRLQTLKDKKRTEKRKQFNVSSILHLST